MEFAVDFTKPLTGDMGVNLGGGNAFVAQEFLKSSYIHSFAQEVCRKRMPYDMRRYCYWQPHCDSIFLYAFFN